MELLNCRCGAKAWTGKDMGTAAFVECDAHCGRTVFASSTEECFRMWNGAMKDDKFQELLDPPTPKR